jgi:hypothetical protein
MCSKLFASLRGHDEIAAAFAALQGSRSLYGYDGGRTQGAATATASGNARM